MDKSNNPGIGAVTRATGILHGNPLRFDTLINFGVVPQEAPSEYHVGILECLLTFISEKSEELTLESIGYDHKRIQVSSRLLNIDAFYEALVHVGDEFDVIGYSDDPTWCLVISANDRVIVFGADAEVLRSVTQHCGSYDEIWRAVQPSLSEASFSEPFWREQRGAVLRWPQ